MKIALFTKVDKPFVEEIIQYLNGYFNNVIIYKGKAGDPLPVRSFDDSQDILISYLSPWIIPKEILKKTLLWNINFHPGPPEYPGIGCFNFAIYNEEKSYGVTAHLIEERVDSGRIIAVKRFSISEKDTVYSLSMKSYECMLALFFESMSAILNKNAIPSSNESWKRNPYTRKELEDLCRINIGMTEEEIKRRIKATTYPKMPGAYIELFGYRFEYNIKR